MFVEGQLIATIKTGEAELAGLSTPLPLYPSTPLPLPHPTPIPIPIPIPTPIPIPIPIPIPVYVIHSSDSCSSDTFYSYLAQTPELIQIPK